MDKNNQHIYRMTVLELINAGYGVQITEPGGKQAEQLSMPGGSHQHGFDFTKNDKTAMCKCGVISTNPYYIARND